MMIHDKSAIFIRNELDNIKDHKVELHGAVLHVI